MAKRCLHARRREITRTINLETADGTAKDAKTEGDTDSCDLTVQAKPFPAQPVLLSWISPYFAVQLPVLG